MNEEEKWRGNSLMEMYEDVGITDRELQRNGEKEKHGLRDELKLSQDRILRSKSGRRTTQKAQSGSKPSKVDLIDQFNNYKQEYIHKKMQLEKQMQGHIERKNNQLSFMNKYSQTNLENYFKRRKELLDLILADQYTRNIVNNPLERGKHEQNVQSQAIEQKIFTQFKIKTKFMKSKVKENILNALAEVKMKLLEENHLSNVKKLTQGNPDTLIALVHQKKRKHAKQRATSNPNHMASAIRFEQMQRRTKSIRHSQSKPTIIRYPNALKTARPLVYQSGWSQQIQNTYRKTIENRLFEGRVPNTSRK